MPSLSSDQLLPFIVFMATILVMIIVTDNRWLIALIGAVIFVVMGTQSIQDSLLAIDWNVLLMIAGTMGTVALFIWSKMPSLLSDMIINKMPNEKWTIIALSVFAGIISAFVDNTSTVLMVAPIAVTLCKKIETSPVPMVIAIAIASNLEGAATLVGDTTSIMLGGAYDMDFLDFFFFNGKPGLFFINQVGLLAASLVLLFIFRNRNKSLPQQEHTVVTDLLPTFMLVGTVLALIIASFISTENRLPAWVSTNINGIICMTIFLVGFIIEKLRFPKENLGQVVLRDFDWQTLVQLASLFMMIAAISSVGVIDWLAEVIATLGGGSVFGLYTIIVWASVIISAFIDNIPYVATMLPVVGSLSAGMGIDPTVFYFGLLCGATLGGNLTPIGASANVAGIGILKKNGWEVPSSQFMKISVPYTLAAISVAYIMVWFLFKPI